MPDTTAASCVQEADPCNGALCVVTPYFYSRFIAAFGSFNTVYQHIFIFAKYEVITFFFFVLPALLSRLSRLSLFFFLQDLDSGLESLLDVFPQFRGETPACAEGAVNVLHIILLSSPLDDQVQQPVHALRVRRGVYPVTAMDVGLNSRTAKFI